MKTKGIIYVEYKKSKLSGLSGADIIESDINGNVLHNYFLYIKDLRKLKSNPVFSDNKYKYIFIKSI